MSTASAREVDDLALRVHRLRRAHRRTALELDCTFEVPTGSITALVGANGAGKTTLLHLLTGLIVPDSGKITVLDRPTSPGRPCPGLAFVAQGAPLYPTLRVAEILSLTRRLHPDWDDAAVSAVLDRAEISRRCRVGALSTGERAQLALGLALATRPALLVLDEPFANLDPVATRSVMSLISAEVAERGTTVLLSTHAVAEVRRLCDRVIVLRRGRVVLSDSVEDLLARHRRVVMPHPSVELLLRSGPQVVGRSDSAREASLLVRDFTPGDIPIAGLRDQSVDLTDLVLAYLT